MLLNSASIPVRGQQKYQRAIGGNMYDYGQHGKVTSDGGVVMTGSTFTYGAGDADVFMVKLDSNGILEWSRAFGTTGMEIGNCILEVKSGGYMIAGYTEPSLGSGNQDVYVIRTDNNGNVIWTKTFGGSNNEEAFSAIETADGGFAIVGWTLSYGFAGDVYLIRLDSAGSLLWSRRYGSNISEERGLSVSLCKNSGFAIAGNTWSFGAGWNDVYLLRTDSAGALLWSATYGGSNMDEGNFVMENSGLDLLVAGRTSSFGSGSFDMYLLATDSAGNMKWSRTYGGTAEEVAYEIIGLSGGNYAMTGWGNSSGWDANLLKLDTLGNVIWAKGYGGSSDDYGRMVNQCSDGGFVVGGATLSFGPGSADLFVVKTDASGNSGCNQVTNSPTVTFPATIAAFQATSDSILNLSANFVTIVDSSLADSVTICFSTCNFQAGFSWSPANICVGDTVLFSSTGTGGQSFEWQINGVTFDSVANPAYGFNNSGNFTITLFVSDSACNLSETQNILIGQAGTAIVQGDTIICAGDSVLISASGGIQIQWTPSSGLACDTCGNTMAAPDSTTTYHVTVLNAGGCNDTGSVTLIVEPCMGILPDFSDLKFQIFPNPFSDVLNVSLCGAVHSPLIFFIGDIHGKRVIEFGFRSERLETRFLTTSLASGIYFYGIQTGNWKIQTGKIIKH